MRTDRGGIDAARDWQNKVALDETFPCRESAGVPPSLGSTLAVDAGVSGRLACYGMITTAMFDLPLKVCGVSSLNSVIT